MKSNLPGSSLIFASIFNVSMVLTGSMTVPTRLNKESKRAVNCNGINYDLMNSSSKEMFLADKIFLQEIATEINPALPFSLKI